MIKSVTSPATDERAIIRPVRKLLLIVCSIIEGAVYEMSASAKLIKKISKRNVLFWIGG